MYDLLPNFVFSCHAGTIFELLSFWIFDIAFDHCQLATDPTALISPPLFLTDAATLFWYHSFSSSSTWKWKGQHWYEYEQNLLL